MTGQYKEGYYIYQDSDWHQDVIVFRVSGYWMWAAWTGTTTTGTAVQLTKEVWRRLKSTK
jgi:hypothetical protein